MSAEAKAQCASLCPDPSFVPTDGLDFLYRSGGYGNAPKSLVGDRDVGVQRAFQCLAILGDQGCEIEGPFEAARRALDGHQLRNGPFLHSRGHLALFFLTDEDDCSVAEARRDENDPTQLVTCPMAGSDADYRCFTPDFRCLAQSVVCTEPLTKAGAKTRCQTRPSYLEPVESYAQFLQGLRPAEKVAVFGIWPPALGLPGTRFEVEVEPGGNLANTFELNRASLDLASCANKAAGVFGRPQLRLSQLAAQFPGGEVDLCKGGGDYQLGMVEAASRLRRLAVNCLPFVPRTDGGRPLCQVGDLADEAGPGPAETFPACRAGCCAAFAASNVPAQVEPEIALACQGEEKTCFCAVASAQPGICSGGVVAAVFRKGEAPANQITNFTCAIP